MARYEFAQRSKGGIAEREDWWTLHVDDVSGEMTVEHEWDYVNAYVAKVRSRGTRHWCVHKFMQSGVDHDVKQQLRKALIKAGRT